MKGRAPESTAKLERKLTEMSKRLNAVEEALQEKHPTNTEFQPKWIGISDRLGHIETIMKELNDTQPTLQQSNSRIMQPRRVLEALSLASDVAAFVILAFGVVNALSQGSVIPFILYGFIAILVFALIVIVMYVLDVAFADKQTTTK